MATNTPNYNLKKPSLSDYYDIAVFNDNADKIDTALESKRNKDDPITVGWESVTGKPTTIDGYGITDSVEKGKKSPPSSSSIDNITGIYETESIYNGPAGMKSYGYINIPMDFGHARVQILADYGDSGDLYFRRIEVGTGPWKRILSEEDLKELTDEEIDNILV